MSDGKLHFLPLGPSEEALLVEQLQKGVPDAFAVLYRRFIGRVFGVALQVVGDRASAEDVAQETFFKVFAQIHRFRGEGRLVSWIYRIAVNLSISEVRRRKRLRQHRAEHPDPNPIDIHSVEPGLSESLRFVLDQLEPQKRLTFYLHHVEGLTSSELAEVFDESRDAVLKRLQRTRRELLLLWQDLEAEPKSHEQRNRRGGR